MKMRPYPHFRPSSFLIVRILDLPRQYHHPQKQHCQDDGPGERGLPTRTDVALRQPGQGLYRDARVFLVVDVGVAIAIDIAVAVQLDRCLDECRDP